MPRPDPERQLHPTHVTVHGGRQLLCLDRDVTEQAQTLDLTPGVLRMIEIAERLADVALRLR
jgi:hypothetical protein